MTGTLSAPMRDRAYESEESVALPDAPVLVAGLGSALWLSEEGEVETIAAAAVTRRLASGARPLVAHMRATARRLGLGPFAAYDVLELFAFARPAEFCLPTPRGLAHAVGLAAPGDALGEALALQQAPRRLLAHLAAAAEPSAARLAQILADAGWSWGASVQAALASVAPGGPGLAVWQSLPEFDEQAPEPAPGHLAVEPEEARRRLAELVGPAAEARPSQADYASAASLAFQPRDRVGEGALVLAEAGTGVGKTLGYIAPASVWAEKNGGAVWISTYTRNLQQQISSELDRLYPDPDLKALKAVVRKGRENYLCLLNYDEASGGLRAGQAPARGQDAVTLALLARWIEKSADGDLTGGDFPGWLPVLLGRPRTFGLADRRGECVYSACLHYRRCFIERSVRRARRADIVVANHALVMVQAALGGAAEDPLAPTRLIFDEGHHVFDAADSAFSGHLTVLEGIELRRWLLGAEAGGRSRARGLRRRAEDLIPDEAGQAELAAILNAARELPAEGALTRLAQAAPAGALERFLFCVREQVLARSRPGEEASLETEIMPQIGGLAAASSEAAAALRRLQAPLDSLRRRLLARLDSEADTLDSDIRLRIESIAKSLERRARLMVAGWISMLDSLSAGPPEGFVDWFALDRAMPQTRSDSRGEAGRDLDLGMHRHHLDPTVPFAAGVVAPTHGVLVTSATLTDGTGEAEADWAAAEARSGARHLAARTLRAQVPSPFDYPAQTRIFIVNDVRREDSAQVAAAYRVLFLAAGGGALGLFTAIRRLRAVHQRIAGALEEAGIPLLAQHVDALETSSLIDIFRAEEDACLLGTDAVRDGVDVPGRSLRLIVFDRVPWPRPDILHKARRRYFGGAAYDDMLTRLKLKQAFGRLVRRADDRGAFVMLDSRLPTRLTGAFPEGVAVQRVGLAEAVAQIREFLEPVRVSEDD